MNVTEKRRIRSLRIILNVLYGFILSSILFRYIIHGIVESASTNPYVIAMIVLGSLILLSMGFAIYATWFNKNNKNDQNDTILLVSGVALILVFILTLIFGIIRIVKTAPHRVIVAKPDSNVMLNTYERNQASKTVDTTNNNLLIEEICKLVFELLAMLLAIIGTFVLHGHTKKNKQNYSDVPTTEPKPS